MADGDRTLRATVTKVDAQGVYVEVPKLGLGVTFGPCQVLLAPFVADHTGRGEGHSHSDPDGNVGLESVHRHPLSGGRAAMRVGHEVLVTTVNGIKEDLVVLGRLA